MLHKSRDHTVLIMSLCAINKTAVSSQHTLYQLLIYHQYSSICTMLLTLLLRRKSAERYHALSLGTQGFLAAREVKGKQVKIDRQNICTCTNLSSVCVPRNGLATSIGSLVSSCFPSGSVCGANRIQAPHKISFKTS